MKQLCRFLGVVVAPHVGTVVIHLLAVVAEVEHHSVAASVVVEDFAHHSIVVACGIVVLGYGVFSTLVEIGLVALDVTGIEAIEGTIMWVTTIIGDVLPHEVQDAQSVTLVGLAVPCFEEVVDQLVIIAKGALVESVVGGFHDFAVIHHRVERKRECGVALEARLIVP